MPYSRVNLFRLFCSGIICVLIGLPLGSLGALQSFLLEKHVYEDRCKVSLSGVAGQSISGILCAESREAYVNIYTSSNLSYALAMFLAYFAARYAGYLFSTICCVILLAGGSVIITEPSQNMWGQDKYALGLALLAAAAPFALANHLNAITNVTASPRHILLLLIPLVVGIQLSPLLWPALGYYLGPQSMVDDLFRAYIWIPCWTLVMVMLATPFSDISIDQGRLDALIIALKMGLSLDLESASNPELTPLLQDEIAQGDSSRPPKGLRNGIPLRLFVALLVGYLAYSPPPDLMLVSGQLRALLGDNVDLSVPLLIASPLVSAVSVLLIFGLSRVFSIRSMHLGTALICSVNLLSQLLNSPRSWSLAASISDVCRQLVLWLMLSLSIGRWGISAYFLLAGVFLTGSTIQWFTLAYIDRAFVFESEIFGHNPFVFGFGAQIVAFWYVARFLKSRRHIALREALDREARIALEHSSV